MADSPNRSNGTSPEKGGSPGTAGASPPQGQGGTNQKVTNQTTSSPQSNGPQSTGPQTGSPQSGAGGSPQSGSPQSGGAGYNRVGSIPGVLSPKSPGLPDDHNQHILADLSLDYEGQLVVGPEQWGGSLSGIDFNARSGSGVDKNSDEDVNGPIERVLPSGHAHDRGRTGHGHGQRHSGGHGKGQEGAEFTVRDQTEFGPPVPVGEKVSVVGGRAPLPVYPNSYAQLSNRNTMTRSAMAGGGGEEEQEDGHFISSAQFDEFQKRFKDEEGRFYTMTSFGAVPVPESVTANIPGAFMSQPRYEERRTFVPKMERHDRLTTKNFTQHQHKFIEVVKKLQLDKLVQSNEIKEFNIPRKIYKPVVAENILQVPQGVKYCEVPISVVMKKPPILKPVPKPMVIVRKIECTKPVVQERIIEKENVIEKRVPNPIVKEIEYVVPNYVKRVVEVPYQTGMQLPPQRGRIETDIPDIPQQPFMADHTPGAPNVPGAYGGHRHQEGPPNPFPPLTPQAPSHPSAFGWTPAATSAAPSGSNVDWPSNITNRGTHYGTGDRSLGLGASDGPGGHSDRSAYGGDFRSPAFGGPNAGLGGPNAGPGGPNAGLGGEGAGLGGNQPGYLEGDTVHFHEHSGGRPQSMIVPGNIKNIDIPYEAQIAVDVIQCPEADANGVPLSHYSVGQHGHAYGQFGGGGGQFGSQGGGAQGGGTQSRGSLLSRAFALGGSRGSGGEETRGFSGTSGVRGAIGRNVRGLAQSTRETGHRLGQDVGHASERAEMAGHHLVEGLSHNAHQVNEGARQMTQSARETAHTMGSSARQTAHNLSHDAALRAQHGVTITRRKVGGQFGKVGGCLEGLGLGAGENNNGEERLRHDTFDSTTPIVRHEPLSIRHAHFTGTHAGPQVLTKHGLRQYRTLNCTTLCGDPIDQMRGQLAHDVAPVPLNEEGKPDLELLHRVQTEYSQRTNMDLAAALNPKAVKVEKVSVSVGGQPDPLSAPNHSGEEMEAQPGRSGESPTSHLSSRSHSHAPSQAPSPSASGGQP